MAANKDHEDVIRFRRAFRTLKDMIDDDAQGLISAATSDETIQEKCSELHWIAVFLRMSESEYREKFSAPVDPKFIEDWRDFEDRYASAVAGVVLVGLGMDVDEIRIEPDEWQLKLNAAALDASEKARAIQYAIDFAQEQASQEHRDFPESFASSIEDGARAWQRLGIETGFDLEKTFLRRDLVPFVLVPRHVSNRHGHGEKLSLFSHLQQAHEAFVFGIPFAALALLRSVLEILLKIHYRAPGENLSERINNVTGLPRNIRKNKLHDIRILTNHILHFEKELAQIPKDLDREIVEYLHIIRILIERAPN